MYKLVPAGKAFPLPGLKETSTYGQKGTFLVLNLLIQWSPAASFAKVSILTDCLNVLLEVEDNYGRGREPGGVCSV